MSHSSLVLYKKETGGTFTFQDSIRDSVMKCETLFREANAEWDWENDSWYRLDLVNQADQVISSKLLKATGDSRLGLII